MHREKASSSLTRDLPNDTTEILQSHDFLLSLKLWAGIVSLCLLSASHCKIHHIRNASLQGALTGRWASFDPCLKDDALALYRFMELLSLVRAGVVDITTTQR